MFGYWMVSKGDWFKYQNAFHRIGELQRWLSGFKDLDLIWDWIRAPDCSIDELRNRYARARQATVYGKAQVVRDLELAQESLKASQKAVRYALATFRALDQYTFDDSDHALLIAAAVEKLDDATVPAYSESQD